MTACPTWNPSAAGANRPDPREADIAFALTAASLPVRDETRAELREEWRRLRSAGTWFDGASRVAIAAEARAARRGAEADTDLRLLVVEATQAVSAAASFVRRDWVDDLVHRGLAIEEYVEVTGLVGRLAAVDSGLEAGAELSRLVSALVSAEGVDVARAALVDAAGGPAAAAAASVCGNFQMMNHVVDATGLPVPEPNRRVARQLGLRAG